MKLPALVTSLALTFLIATPTWARPLWEKLGRTNSGSEIALDVNSINTVDDSTTFNYRITKNGESSVHYGVVGTCNTFKSWEALVDNSSGKSITVQADSKASKAMLKMACEIAVVQESPTVASKPKRSVTVKTAAQCQSSRDTIAELRAAQNSASYSSISDTLEKMTNSLENTLMIGCVSNSNSDYKFTLDSQCQAYHDTAARLRAQYSGHPASLGNAIQLRLIDKENYWKSKLIID